MICITPSLWVWPLSPSRVGPPFFLSEPNTNYLLATDPQVGLGMGGRTFGSLPDLKTFLLNLGGPAQPLYHPAGSLALEPHPLQCLALVFFFSL